MHNEVKMKKTNKLFSYIINIFSVILLSYIASTAVGYKTIIVIVTSATMASLSYLSSKKIAPFYCIMGIISYALFYITNTDFVSLDKIIVMLIEIIDLYLPSVFLYKCFCNKKSSFTTCVKFVTGANLIVLIISLAKTKYIDNVNIISDIDATFSEFITYYGDIISANANLINKNINNINEILIAAKDGFIMMLPSFLIISSLIIGYIISALSVSIIKTRIQSFHINNKFNKIYFGRKLNIITIVTLLLSFIIANPYISSGLYNFLVILSVLYITDGLALLNYFIEKKTKNRFLTRILTVFIFIFSIFSVASMPVINGFSIMFFAGMLDSTHDFRKIRRVTG